MFLRILKGKVFVRAGTAGSCYRLSEDSVLKEGFKPATATQTLCSNLIKEKHRGWNEEIRQVSEELLRKETHTVMSLQFIFLLDFLPLFLHFPSPNPASMLSPGKKNKKKTARTPLFLSPTQHTLTFSCSGWDDSFISSLDPPPAPFSLHSPPFAELPPYRGVCVGVDEGSFCSVHEHLHQWKRVGQGLLVSPQSVLV